MTFGQLMIKTLDAMPQGQRAALIFMAFTATLVFELAIAYSIFAPAHAKWRVVKMQYCDWLDERRKRKHLS